MKKLLFAVALIAAVSCSLRENPYSEVNRDKFYKTEEQCLSALRACYTPIYYIYNDNMMYATEACTDLFGVSSNNDNSYLNISPANPGCATTVWVYSYKGIMRANECEDCISRSALADEVKAPLVAEAKVIRALYYYILTSFFGGVPFYDYPVSTVEVMEKIRLLPRMEPNEIREKLYLDLKNNAIPAYTAENGLRCRSNQVANQHAGFALGAMLMAKFALWNHDWQGAVEAVELLESVYGSFTEAHFPLEKTQWRYSNIDESIFEIEHAWDLNGVQFAGNVSAVMTPTSDKKGNYDGVALPELGSSTITGSVLQSTRHFAVYRTNGDTTAPNTDLIETYEVLFPGLPLAPTNEYNPTVKSRKMKIDMDAIRNRVVRGEPLDMRTVYHLGIGNVQTGATFSWVATNGRVWAGPKFWCPNQIEKKDANNYRLFRYADAILMKAEAYAELSNSSEAVRYLNMVRRRAGIGDYAGETDHDALMHEIQDERARELAGEFHRKFDLVRWGIWYESVKKWTENTKIWSRTTNTGTIRPCHEYYPIPDTECALTDGALTNDAYKIENTDENE